MTNEQVAWLKANPTYRPIGVIGGMMYYSSRGTLQPDGTFIPYSPKTPVTAGGGAFGVGVPTSQQTGLPMVGHQGPGGLQQGAADKSMDLVEPATAGTSAPPPPNGSLPKKE